MKNLIPAYIAEQYMKKQDKGGFTACSVFIDISGFTSTTEALMEHGKEGAEVLSDILKFLFSTAVESIYSYGGFITRYAGDAFTALFITDGDDELKARGALKAALEIQNFFMVNHRFESRFGDFEFAVKIGLSYGQTDWGIVGNDLSKAYYFKGYAVDNCAFAEHHCQQGDICADEKLIRLVDDLILDKQLKSENGTRFYRLDRVGGIPLDKPQPRIPEIPEKIISLFTGENELHFPGGEFREAVSVFISFDNVADLDSFFNTVIEQQEAYGGSHPHLDFGDKGGNILVFFGAPVSYENNEERALKFILGIRNEIDPSIRLRAGIARGILYVGYNGVDLRQEFTCLGNTVNQSARFMMKAGWGELLTDERISENKSFKFVHKGDFQYKGRAGTIPTYQLMKEAEKKQVFFKGQFFGREKELSMLLDAIEPIRNHRFGGIVYVDGIAGVGKSRLVHELKRKLSRKQYTWIFMRCDGILRKSFNPVIYFFENYFNVKKENTPGLNKSNFESRLKRLIEQTTDAEIKKELIRTSPFLGALLNLHWENSLYEKLDAKARYENTLYAIKNLIKAESLIKPVVIEIEDSHWVDSDTVNLLQVLTRNVDDYPFVIIAPCRFNDDNSSFNFGLGQTMEKRIHIHLLDKDTAEALIRDKLSCRKLPAKTLDMIWEKSEGNPFYIEQMVLYLKENNLLDKDFNLIHEDIELPSGINSIIVARIDRLTKELKEIVKTASALGREFAVTILSAMLKDQSLDQYLKQGENETIWNHVSEIDYVFKNALIRDAVYEMQLKKQLRKLHLLAGETMEIHYKDQLEMYYSDLANHFEKAEIEDKALFYLEKAGHYARDNYQNTEAVGFYDKLLSHFEWVNAYLNGDGSKDLSAVQVKEDHVKGIKKYLDICLEKANILQLTGQWDEAEQIYKDLLTLATIIDDQSRKAHTYSQLGGQKYIRGSYDDAMEQYRKSLELYESVQDEKGITRVVANMGLVLWRQGKNEEAMESFERMKQLSEKQKDLINVAKAIGNIGLIYQAQRNYTKAMEYFQKQLEIDEKLGDKQGISVATMLMGVSHYYLGNLEKAMEYFEARVALSEELGDKKGISDTIGNIGSIYQKLGDFKKALECSQKQLKLSRELGDKRGIGNSSNYLGEVYRRMGKLETAVKYFKIAYELAIEMKNTRGSANAAGRLGELHVELGDFDTALKYYDKAIGYARQLNIHEYRLGLEYQKAELLFLKGELNEAEKLNEAVLTEKSEKGITDKVFEGEMLRGRINFMRKSADGSWSLYDMLKNTESESEMADIHYELFKLTKGETHQKPALEFYKKLKAKAPDTPNYELDKRLAILRGEKPV